VETNQKWKKVFEYLNDQTKILNLEYVQKISENNFYDGYIGDKNASYQDIVKYIIQTGKIANEYILKNIV